ncbi:MAG: LacI family transcriptional regulator [Halanaerobiales bacterium]|nr:LacI family transcriptional regulator [Halanaerobiales bacterium]
MTITMKDVASKAGVSLSTVSRVINNSTLVSKETTIKVKKTIDQLDYQINDSARALRTNISNLIGVIGAGMDNPFLMNALKSIETKALKKNYNIIYGDSDGELEQELYYVNMFKQKKVDGLIIMTANFSDELINSVKRSNISTIFASGYLDQTDLLSVTVNNIKAAEDVSDYLFDLSDYFAIIRGPYNDSVASKERMQGVKNKYKEYNIDLKDKYISEGNFTFESGYKSAEILLNNNKDLKAIFAFNDQMAIGAIKYCLDNKIKIPEEISIVGFDGIEASKYIKPTLSTVFQSGNDLGSEIMENLLKLMADENVENDNIFIPHKLIIRESSI